MSRCVDKHAPRTVHAAALRRLGLHLPEAKTVGCAAEEPRREGKRGLPDHLTAGCANGTRGLGERRTRGHDVVHEDEATPRQRES